MSSVLPARGIVLYKREYTENHGMYTILTREFGKLTCLCRGSRKLQSKLSPHLEGFGISDLMLLFTATRVQIIGAQYDRRFQGIFEDYQKILYASYCFELIDGFMKSGDPCSDVFDELVDILEYLNDNSGGFDLFVHVFGLRLLGDIGFLPELFSCVSCGLIIAQADQLFRVDCGGLCCSVCSLNKQINGITISENTIKLLRLALCNSFQEMRNIGIDHHIRVEFARIVQSYITYHVERDLRSIKLLVTR